MYQPKRIGTLWLWRTCCRCSHVKEGLGRGKDVVGKCDNCGHQLCEGCERHRKTEEEVAEETRLEAEPKLAASEVLRQMLVEKRQDVGKIKWFGAGELVGNILGWGDGASGVPIDGRGQGIGEHEEGYLNITPPIPGTSGERHESEQHTEQQIAACERMDTMLEERQRKMKDEHEVAAKRIHEKMTKAAADEAIAAEGVKVEVEMAEAARAVADRQVAAAKAKAEAIVGKAPAEKLRPIKFKDAFGRKFNFPFELCQTWKGMNDLICQAFAHVEPFGQMVAEGNYDLIGPSGDIILPQIWETVIEPDWAITMHMWPIKEVTTERPAAGHPGMNMRHTAHPPGQKGGKAALRLRDQGVLPPSLPALAAPMPGGSGWIGPLPGGGREILANKPRKKQGASGWGSLFSGTAKAAIKKKKNEDILHSAIPSRSNPQAPLQVGLALTHEEEEDDPLNSSFLRRQRPLSFYSPSEEQQRISGVPFAPPQSAESSYPSVSEFRVTEYTKQREAEAEAKRQKQSELEGAAIKPSDASSIQAVAHSDAEKKRLDVKHGQKAQHLEYEVEPRDALLKPPASQSDGDNPEVEQPEQAADEASPTETSDAPAVINITADKGQPEAEQGKQAELVEDNVEAWDAPQTLLPPIDSNKDEERQVARTEKQTDHAGDSVESKVAPPTPPASDSEDHLDVWSTPPSTYVPFEVVLPLPSEVPLPRSPPLTPARATTPPPALPPLSPASVQSSTSPFGPLLLYAGRDGKRIYAPYQYEQVNPPAKERSPLSVVWSVVFCLSLGTISLVILTFGTTTALIDERKSSTSSTSTEAPHMPSISDAGFSLTLQSSLWAVTNLIAGLIPACMHATRYRKWLRMNYAWLPAVVCLVMVVASVPIYLRSPALSNGLAGVANIPMGLFIFFASFEAMREEGHGKGCGGKCGSERFEGSERSSGDSLRKGSERQIELSSLG